MADIDLGKKIFFLYPHSVIKDTLARQIIQAGFEVYLLKDHKKVSKLLKRYNDSILFINIDEGMPEPEWETFIKQLMEDPDTAGIRIGILSYETNDTLKMKYLMEVGIQCGFIVLKLGLQESTKIILKTLEANEAKGRRKYIRARCEEQDRALFNVKIYDELYTGKVLDLSIVGLACLFDTKEVPIAPKQLIKDIQIRLKGALCMVTGVILGTRETEEGIVYVILFSNQTTPQAKAKVMDFVYTLLQNHISRELMDIT